jgi:hypothetical protein
MAKQYEYRVTVTAVAGFPIDMLRYDGLAPEREQDSGAIERSIRNADVAERVQLVRWAPKGWHPTAGRWSSFMCTLHDCVTTGRVQ